MTPIEKAKAGICELCDSPLHHGPYTDAQIAEIQQEVGLDSDDFSDYCDNCFLQHIAGGDEERAAHYLSRPLQLRKGIAL